MDKHDSDDGCFQGRAEERVTRRPAQSAGWCHKRRPLSSSCGKGGIDAYVRACVCLGSQRAVPARKRIPTRKGIPTRPIKMLG